MRQLLDLISTVPLSKTNIRLASKYLLDIGNQGFPSTFFFSPTRVLPLFPTPAPSLHFYIPHYYHSYLPLLYIVSSPHPFLLLS